MNTITYLIEEHFLSGLTTQTRKHFFKVLVKQAAPIYGADYYEGWATLGTFGTEGEAKKHLVSWISAEAYVD